MDFNYNKLKGKITEKYGTQLSFARAMGVSERTLSLKLNNRVAFSQPEIFLASQLLGINMSALDAYFFTPEVQKLEPIA